MDDSEWLKNLHGHLGVLHYDAGDYEKAISAYRGLLACYPENDPWHPTILCWIGQCAIGMRDYGGPRRRFEPALASPWARAETREEAERQALSCSARLAKTAGDDQTAIELLRRLLERCADDDSERRRALIRLGHCYYALSRCGEALACYDEVRASPPASAEERAEAQAWADWRDGRRRDEAGGDGEDLTSP